MGLTVREEWGRLIRRYRRMNDLSQEALAEELGCTQAAVTSWERGLRSPTPDLLVRCVQVLGIPPAELFSMVLDRPAEAVA